MGGGREQPCSSFHGWNGWASIGFDPTGRSDTISRFWRKEDFDLSVDAVCKSRCQFIIEHSVFNVQSCDPQELTYICITLSTNDGHVLAWGGGFERTTLPRKNDVTLLVVYWELTSTGISLRKRKSSTRATKFVGEWCETKSLGEESRRHASR